MLATSNPAPNHANLTDRPRFAAAPSIDFFEKIEERIQKHHDHFQKFSPDYDFERLEFGKPTGGDAHRYKARPYDSYQSLMGIQHLGHVLRSRSVAAIAIQENFTSYAISKGITYDVKVQRAFKDNSAVKSEAEECQDVIDAFVDEHCWPIVQEEALNNRLLTTGEIFRQYDQVDGKLDWAFVDAHEVRPPESHVYKVNTRDENGNLKEPPPFGIEYQDGQARKPTQYWINSKQVPASNVQHAKIGVDSRDPRGVPLLWMGYPSAREVDELDYAASQAGLAYAKHTVVYEYEQGVDPEDIDKIAKGATDVDVQAKKLGKLNAGGSVHHAHRYTVKDLAAGWSEVGFVGLIDFKCRMLGNIASVPEFISTGRADTGSRNTLISAEAPLTRRVERVAGQVAKFDIDLMYQVLAVHFGKFGNEAWLAEFKTRIKLKPSFTTPDGRDAMARQKMTVELMEKGYLDEPSGIRELGGDPDGVLEGRAKWARSVGDMQENLRQDGHLNDLYDSEELARRYDTLAVLISAGITEDEALERLGLDAIEDRSALEDAIARRNAVLDMTGEENPDDDDDDGEGGSNPDNPSNDD